MITSEVARSEIAAQTYGHAYAALDARKPLDAFTYALPDLLSAMEMAGMF